VLISDEAIVPTTTNQLPKFQTPFCHNRLHLNRNALTICIPFRLIAIFKSGQFIFPFTCILFARFSMHFIARPFRRCH
jgi:hypothetical protein